MNTCLTKLANKRYIMDVSTTGIHGVIEARQIAREMFRVGIASYILFVDSDKFSVWFKDAGLELSPDAYSAHKLRLFERGIEEGSPAHRRYIKSLAR